MTNVSRSKTSRISTGSKIQFLQILLCVLLGTTVAGSYFMQKMLGEKQHQMLGRMESVSDLMNEIKAIQLDAVQVQQYVQDIAATRGQDGLDDGLDEAATHAESFKKRIADATSMAQKLGASDIVSSLGETSNTFGPYYEMGVAMAKAYVAEGPAGGNKLMSAFDGKATAIGDAMDKLIAIGQSKQNDITKEAAQLQAQNNSFLVALIAVGGFAIFVGVGVVLLTFILQRQASTAQKAADKLSAERAEEAQRNVEIVNSVITKLSGGLQGMAEGHLDH